MKSNPYYLAKLFILVLTILLTCFWAGVIPSRADDIELFMTHVPPDVLILLDRSISMNNAPSGDPAVSPSMRRIDIAKNIIFDMLDDNDDNKINTEDEKSLEIRFGYMRFWNAKDEDDHEPKTGSIKVLSDIGSPYQTLWNQIMLEQEANPLGGTPLAASLQEVKTYFERDVNKKDIAVTCRKKYVILITDGADTLGCNGNGADPNCKDESSNSGMSRRRMLTVLRAKELSEAGIKTFVIGFGKRMPECLKRTLNWIGKYGGTDNALETNTGDPRGYDISRFGEPCQAEDPNADPARYPLSGYAFLAEDASQISHALKTIMGTIQGNSYSFSDSACPSMRQNDSEEEAVIYLPSFNPVETPFWRGNLKAYRLNTDGKIALDELGKPLVSENLWDSIHNGGAGEILNKMKASDRNIYTDIKGSLKRFDNNNIRKEDLDVETDEECNKIVSHVRGQDAYDIDPPFYPEIGYETHDRSWKLGDILHSNPVIVGPPSRYFKDTGFDGPDNFYEENKKRTKVVIVGANDGMLHAFNAATGAEEWAFIPNGLLKYLKQMTETHRYYVDASPKVADVWFYSRSNDKTKSVDEWKTILICGLRGGGNHYFALDITDTKAPKYLWEFSDSELGESWSEPAIGRVKIEQGGTLSERWVAFLGGGYDQQGKTGKAFFVIDVKTGEMVWKYLNKEEMGESKSMIYPLPASPTAVDTNLDGYIDKVYIGDLGGQMWVFNVSFDERNNKSNSQWTGRRLFIAPSSRSEKHSIYYQPAVAFDRNKKLWVYFGTGDRENPRNLKGSSERFYALRDDEQENELIKEDNLRDISKTNTFNMDDPGKGWFIKLEQSEERSEKVLAKPVIFDQFIYFTTYTYIQSMNPCGIEGMGRLYKVNYLSGEGGFFDEDMTRLDEHYGQRSKEIGPSMPSAPHLSVTTKGKTSITIGTATGKVYSDGFIFNNAQKGIIYWREIIP